MTTQSTKETINSILNAADFTNTQQELTSEVFHHALENWRINAIAVICHEVNGVFNRRHQDYSQPSWKNAPDWMRQSALNGVAAHIKENHTPEQSHVVWYNDKVADGWVYGPEKDPVKKTHPCMVPYNELPKKQQTKDVLFSSLVNNLHRVYSPNAPISLTNDGIVKACLSVANDYLEFIGEPTFNESFFLGPDCVREFNKIHEDIIRREIRDSTPEEIVPHLNRNVDVFARLNPDEMMFLYIFLAVASKTWTIPSLLNAQRQMQISNEESAKVH